MPADAEGNWILGYHDRDRIEEILQGDGTWFSAHLLRLIQKADADNRERLRKGFPKVVEAYEEWYHGRTESK